MKSVVNLLLIIIFFTPVSLVFSQKGMWKGQKYLLKEKDPEKTVKFIEAQSANSRGKPKIYFNLLLADQLEKSGDFSKAEKIYLETYQLARRLKSKPTRATFSNHSGTIYDSYDRLGYFYLRTGNLRKAEQIFLESKAVRDSIFPHRSVHRIHPVVGLGSLRYRRGEFEKTYDSFNQAEKMLGRATTTWYDYDIVTRLFLNDLSEICLMQGRNQEAWDYINNLSVASSGIAKFGSRIGAHQEIARIFELKARYFFLEGDYQKAQDYLDRANRYYPPKLASSEVKFKLLKTQALLHWQQGNIEQSNEAFLGLIKSYRQHIALNFISMSEYEKEQFYNTLRSDFNLFNAYAANLYSTHQPKLFEEIYNNVLNTKALLLNETNKIKNHIIQGGNAQLIDKLHQWEQAKAQLSSSYFDKEAVGRIDSLEKKIEGLEKEINEQSQLFRKNENPPDWKQIQAALKDGEAAIEILRINTISETNKNGYGKNSGLSDSTIYLAMILKPDSDTPQCIFVPNGNQLELKYLPYYRNSIFTRDEAKVSYHQFWTPLKGHLKGTNKVYLSPDGVFNQINLYTLKNPVSHQYLLDEIELVYLTNTADLLRQGETDDQGQAVLFGRPSYNFEREGENNFQSDKPVYGTRNLLMDELESFKDQEFIDLPGTELEITEIEATLKAREVRVQIFKGPDALEENVKAVSSPLILHIATHGFFVEDSASLVNPMIRSGLVLAGVKNQEQRENEDGILTAYEATNLNLEKTSLVALSACETGLGEVRNGEGVYGLQRAIIVAGANNLLMSLWKVDDAATASLMSELYKTWDPHDNQKAFRNAQKVLRQKYPEPFYWGAFIMLGK